jgi:hypothetical protein
MRTHKWNKNQQLQQKINEKKIDKLNDKIVARNNHGRQKQPTQKRKIITRQKRKINRNKIKRGVINENQHTEDSHKIEGSPKRVHKKSLYFVVPLRPATLFLTLCMSTIRKE